MDAPYQYDFPLPQNGDIFSSQRNDFTTPGTRTNGAVLPSISQLSIQIETLEIHDLLRNSHVRNLVDKVETLTTKVMELQEHLVRVLGSQQQYIHPLRM
jgi:hypothetical protein